MSQSQPEQEPRPLTKVPRETAADIGPGKQTDRLKKKQAREIGGRKGPEPTRYGDWEKNGRCIDF